MISSAQEFVDHWEGVRGRTRRVVLLIPRDRFEWSPGPGRWTFGDIVRHLAGIERDMHAENVMGRPSRYPGHGRELADGFEAALEYLDRKHREAVGIFSGLEPARLQARCLTPAGIEITTWKWLRAMVEHEAHHRGQLYLMLGMLGVQPPQLYGLSEEEVKARSS